MTSEKKPFTIYLIWTVMIVSGLIILGRMAVSSYLLWKKRDIVLERETYLHQIEQQQVELKKQLSDSLKPEFIEKEARNKLGLVKDSETLIILPESSAAGQSNTSVNTSSLSDPIWRQWWKVFF